MTSTNDGKDVKSNQTSGQKDKKYFIELYKSLDARLIAGGDLRTCTQSLCDAWRRVHRICLHSTPSTHEHLLDWIQRHTARVILLTEWQSPKSEHLHSSLEAAIDSFVEDRGIAVGNRNGHSPPWECQLLQRALWFKGTLSNPWGHPVLKALLDPTGERPSYDEILEWLKEERGVTFVSRLRQLAASKKCDDLALKLASVVTSRARADAKPFSDADQVEQTKDKPPTEISEPTFESILRNEADFTSDIWNLLTDIELVLLHKIEGNSRCIELVKLTPLHNGGQLIKRLASRLDAFPREKKLWKNAKDVAMLVAQVTVARCMVIPQCSGPTLYGAAYSLARLAQGDRLAKEAATLAAPAATANHLHTLAAAVHDHAQHAKCEDRKSFVCELYVRAITSGMYELEKLKMKTEEEPKARYAEKTLATWFTQLGGLLSASARIQYECTLTAFSLHPAPDMYECIKAAPDLPPVAMDFQEPKAESTSDYGSWANDSRSNTNFVKTSETLNIKHQQHQANVLSTAILTEGEALGLSAELCQDIAVLLSGPRVKTLSWDVDRQVLLENCRTYMERTHGGTRALTTELKYLNLDPRCFDHLPEEQDDENDLYYGIEKGYEQHVEFEPQPEEIWQYAWDTEPTESAYSDCIDSDHRASTVTRRKKKVKQSSTSEEDSDPLSQVAEAKRAEEKKERPHSKERSKDKKKSKSHAKDPTQKETDRRKARAEKKKEKKERKKKEIFENLVDTKTGALSNLIGVKVANMSVLHDDKIKVKEEANLSNNVFIDSDPNSEGNESSIVYDGQFSMDELKSPERKSPDIIKNVVNKNNMNVSVGMAEHRPKRPPTPPPRLNINKNLQLNNTNIVQSKVATPPLNDSETSRLNPELNTQNKVEDVKEQVKQSITKLIQFRRQKMNATDESASVMAPLIGQSVTNKPIPPKPTHYVQNKSGLSSLVGSKIVNASKVQLDPKQTEQLVDFKNEINNFLSNANNQRPVIEYANKNYGTVTYNKHHIKESCSRVQPVAYNYSKQASTNASQTNRPEQPKPPIIVHQNHGKMLNNKPHKPVMDPSKHIHGHQQTFQEFIKEFELTKANLLKTPQQRQPRPADRAESVRKQMRPVSKVTPVIPNTMKPELIPVTNVIPQPVQPSVNKPEHTVSPQCAKPTQQNKLDNAPNTFARRIYMHKNNLKTKHVVQHPTLQSSVSAEIDRRIENLTLKMKNKSKDLVISRVPNDAQTAKSQTPPRVEIQKVSKPKPAVKLEAEHPVLTNMLQIKCNKQKTPEHNNVTKTVSTEPVKSPAPNLNRYTSLTEKDQQDLLVLLRQQSMLKKLKPDLNINKIHNGPSIDIPSTSYTVTSNNCGTIVPSANKPVEVKSNLDDHVIPMFSDPTASKQPSTQQKTKPVKESIPKITYTKIANFYPNTIQKAPLDFKKDNAFEDSINVTQTKESAKQDWARVLDALRSHKTPSRGPNAIDMVLKKDSYATYTDNSLRNQRIVKPSTITEGIKVVAKPHQPAVLNKVVNTLVKSSTSTEPVIAKPHKSDISKAQSQAIKKLNLNDVTVKYPDKRELPYELQKGVDPFISGIPNSDYDLLEELMDDDLRQEIGELLSDEECYRSPTGAIPKSSKNNIIKITENVVTKSVVQKKPNLELEKQILTNVKDTLENIQQRSASNIAVKNTPHNIRPSASITSNNKPIIISNEKIIHKITAPAANANIIHQLPKNIVISSKRENTELFNVNNIATVSNPQNQQSTNITPTNVFVARQPMIPNMVSVSSDSIYDPFATQLKTGLYNVNHNRYMPVTNVQNMNMYQTTRYAPASSILIGSTITVAVPKITVPTPSITVPFNTVLPSSETSTVFSPTKDMPNSTWSNQSCHIQPTNITTAIPNKPYEPKNTTQVIVKEPSELIAKKASEPIAKKPAVAIAEIPSKALPMKSTKPMAVKPVDPIERLSAAIMVRKPTEPITKKANESVSPKSADPNANTQTEPISMTPSELIAVSRSKSIDKKLTDSIAKKSADPIANTPTEPISMTPSKLRAVSRSKSLNKKLTDSIAKKSADPIANTPTEPISMTPSELRAVSRSKSLDKKLTDSIAKKPIELIAKIPTEPTAQNLTDASKVAEAEKKDIKSTTDDNKLKPEVVHKPNVSNSILDNKPNCDLNKNCERKVLSQVQEKQNAILAEKVDPKNSRSQRISFETTTKKEGPDRAKDQERLMKKRLTIINRQINHCSLSPAIPLTYSPLVTIKEIKLISNEDKQTNVTVDQTNVNSTLLNIVITKVDKLQPSPIETQGAPDGLKESNDTEEFSNENSKENNSNACRRILLRSSNKLKPAAPEVLNKPAGRKTKVRLKSTTTESLEKLGEQITVKRVIKRASVEEINDQNYKPLLDNVAIDEGQKPNAKTKPMNDDSTTDESDKIVQNEKVTSARASKRILNKITRKTSEKEIKIKTKPKKKHRRFKLPKGCSESDVNVNLENSGSITNLNSNTNADFFDIEEALVPIKIPNVNLLHEKISDTIESQRRHNTNTNEDKNKLSVHIKPSLQVNVVAKKTDKDISNEPIVSSPEQISNGEFPIESVNKNEVITSPKKALPEKKETNDKFDKLVDEIESAINELTKSTTEMLEDFKSKENNSILATDGTLFENKPTLISKLSAPDKDHDKSTTKTKESKIIYSEPILVTELSPIIINTPGNKDDNEKSKLSTCREQVSLHNIPNLNKNDIIIDPKIKNKGHQLTTFDCAGPSGFVCSKQNKTLTNSEVAAGGVQNNQELNDIHIPQVKSLKSDVNMKSSTLKDNISPESIPQGYKDSIKIEELPMINSDPFKKIVRVTLPNNRVFKATIYGKTHVSFDSLFENPELKKILTSGISDRQRYTVNIQQVHSTLDNKIVDARITAINVNPKIQNTSAMETVNLISDDEEEEVEHNFVTEFGTYKIKPLNKELLTNHQKKFSQKCTVKLVYIDSHASKPVAKAGNTLEKFCEALPSSDDTDNTPAVNEVIEIDDSSNDSDVTVAKPAEKINQLKNLLLKDLGVEDVLQISNADDLLKKPTEIPVKNQECVTRKTKKRKSVNNDATEVQYEEIVNRKYFVKLVRCDDKVKNITMNTKEDLITKAIDENEYLDNDDNSEAALSRSGSFSILNDLEVFEDLPIATKNESRSSSPVIDIFETIAALGISCSKQDYDRSSPVMEVYDMIASLTSSTVAKNIENVKSYHSIMQEQIKCDTEWFATKRNLYLNLSKDVNNVICINDDESASDSKTFSKLDESTDCEGVFDITFGSVNSTESLSLFEVPSLISIMSQYFANNPLVYNLKPICVMKKCELAKTTVTLKRKLKDKFTNTTNKIIKMSTPVSEDVTEEKVTLIDINAGIDKDVINELEDIVHMSTLNSGFESNQANATSTFLTHNGDVHDHMMITNIVKQDNKETIFLESDITKDTAIRGCDEITAASTIIEKKNVIMIASNKFNIENATKAVLNQQTKTDHIVSVNGVEEMEAHFKGSNDILMSGEITTASEIMDMLETNNINSCHMPIVDSGIIVKELLKNHSADDSMISNQIIKTEQDTALNEVKEHKTDFSKNNKTSNNQITTAFQTIDILENDITDSRRILKPDLDVTECIEIKKDTDLCINHKLTINNVMEATAETEDNTANDNTKCQVSVSDEHTSVKNDLQIVNTVLRNCELMARYQMTAVSETTDNSENDDEVNDNLKVLPMNTETPDSSSTLLWDENIQIETESEAKTETKEHENTHLKLITGLQKELNKEVTDTFSEKSDLQFEEVKTTKVIESEIDNNIALTEAELSKSTELIAIDKMLASVTKNIVENITESIGQEGKANDDVRDVTKDMPTATKSKKNHSENLSSDKKSETIEKYLDIPNDNESDESSLANTSLEVESYIEIECNTSYESHNVDLRNILISNNGEPTEAIVNEPQQCHIGSINTPSPITCTRESSSDIEIIYESNKELTTDIPTYKTVKDVVEIDHKYVCETEVFVEVVESATVHPGQKTEIIEESDDLFISKDICDENPLEDNTTLVYKDDSGVILKGIEYDDPIIGACYVFPLSKSSDSSSSDMLNDSTENIDVNQKIESQLTNNIEEVDKEDQNYVTNTEAISETDTSNKIDEIPTEEYDEDIQLIVPKIKYTHGNLKRKLKRDVIMNEKRMRRNLKCKCEVACDTNIFRKGRHINLPKQTIAAISKTSYAKEYKLRSEYYSSVKFSYSLPFHKDYVCVSDLVKEWPIKGCSASQKSTEEMEHDSDLFTDVNFPIRRQQTLAEELLTGNNESEYSRSNTDADEKNSSMGFGEWSGRVIQNLENVIDISNFSAATLSDVKQSQPLLLSVDNDDHESDSSIHKPINNEKETIARFMTSIKMRDKVRSFFKTSMLALTSQWFKDKQDKKYSTDSDMSPYPELSIPVLFEPPLTQFVVQVVQVGQLPVSAAAQNPMNCDPRVTQVSDASPSQCSVDNSPNDGSQEIKTEYTELKTADLSMPLVEDFFSHHHSMTMESHDRSNTSMLNENLPIETEFIKSEVKIEIEEPSQDSLQESPLGERPLGSTAELHEEIEELREELPKNPYESRVLQSKEARNTEEINYSYDTDHIAEPDVPQPEKEMTFETAEEQIRSTTNQNINDPYSEEKLQNGTLEKTDQIAHAMSAAGITSSPEPETNTEERPLVNVLVPRQGSVSTSKITASNYSKAAPITAMALQQALAQILPPPLNQTNTSESHQQNENPSVGPQVLHIVQGKNASGNQITLVDNCQQSVISTSNATPVLHIVQNKSGSSGPTANGSSTPQTNTFSGLSLVEAGLQQGGNQLLHIVNAGNQKNTNTGQLLKRVNLLTNLTNVQGSNEQKMVQFVCKSTDGKAIQLNAPHQRSMVLRLQPIETPPKPAENQEPSSSATHSAQKESVNSQQEIKSRSVYEENYAKFIQNSSNKLPALEKSTSLPKFNQAFGKPQFQDGTQKQNEINGNSAHSENPESTENPINLDHISQITSPPLLIRKANNPTSQAQPNLQQVKQTITPMNIQTMHGGVIYTRQIPVNIGGGQTINLITVPSTELIDESGQKQQAQGDIDPAIIKIVPQSQHNAEASREDNNNSTNEAQNPQPQPQPVLTQMRIKLPMLSKAPAMVSGARVVRPSFFQIQRNVIGGANQPVYQQLVLTAAPPLGQQTIRIPNARQIKVPDNQTSSESQMSSSTLEQLREFDMVLEQVKERSTGQPKPHTSSNDTTDSSPSGSSAETTQVLYSIGSNQPLNVTYVNRKTTVATPSTSTYVRSPDSSGIVDSPTSSTHIQLPHTSAESTSSETPQTKAVKVGSKNKSKSKSHHQPSSSMKINTVPPKTSNQKPLEDEQTTQRILYILAEYKEQVENSPDKDKPAPRRRTNPPTNPSGSSKRKKSGCRRPGMRDMSPIHGEDTCRTMGSEDSSCGTSQGDCTESCLETHSPQDSPRKVVRKLTFDNESSTSLPRIQPQRNVFVADGQTITVARGTAGKPTTAVLMPANYILPVSMVKGGQQIAIVTNRGPKILTVGGGEGGTTNALLLQRLIGPAGLKPVLARPGVRHVRLPAAALQNLQAFNLATSTNVQPPDSTASPAPAPTPPEVIETQPESSPWTDRESDNARPDRASSPEGSEPWNLPSSADPHDYTYDDTVRVDNLDRTVLEPIPDRYSPELEAERIFDKMFDVESKKSFIVDSHDDSPRCVYDIDASDSNDKHYQVVHKKDGSQRQHRLAHVSAAALRHKYAILEHELRLQKSLSEECEDLGVDSPSASELFPEAELLFAASPAANDHAHDPPAHAHTSQPTILNQGPIQPDIDDQIATDQLIPRERQDLGLGLEDVGIVTVSEDGMQATIELDQEEFARSHPNTTFHSEPTDDGVVQPFTLSGLKSRQITSTIFHANRAPATVLMTAPQTTVISQATAENTNAVKYDIDNMINSLPGPQNNINLNSVLVKDDGLTRFDSILTDSRELHLSNTASAIIHSTGNATQVIRRVCYDDEKRDRFLMDEPDAIIAGDDPKMVAEDSRDATFESMAGDVDDDNSSTERHAELFWESNSASERSESRRPLDFSSDSDKCCKSPSYDETNSTDSSGVGTHMRLDSVIKNARGLERSGSAEGSSADDTQPLRTYQPKRQYSLEEHADRSLSGKTRAGERSPDMEVRRRASGRGVVKRGCHCCNGSPAPPRPKKPRQRKATMDFTNN